MCQGETIEESVRCANASRQPFYRMAAFNELGASKRSVYTALNATPTDRGLAYSLTSQREVRSSGHLGPPNWKIENLHAEVLLVPVGSSIA